MAAERPNAAYLSGAVHREELPVLLVIHEEDGDWQFLDGGLVDMNDSPVVVHISHVFERHLDLDAHGSPRGMGSRPASVADGWRRFAWRT